jgi:hypothetical protein
MKKTKKRNVNQEIGTLRRDCGGAVGKKLTGLLNPPCSWFVNGIKIDGSTWGGDHRQWPLGHCRVAVVPWK